jgi:ribosomal-protein-alanine N-acetyltransferase
MIRRDMPAVLEIENASFECPWSEEDFVRCLRQRNCIGMVVEARKRIAAFMVFELRGSSLRLLSICVDPSFRRRGIGTRLISRLVKKLPRKRRGSIIVEVRESNVEAQVFFRRAGFRAVRVIRALYDDCSEDAYVMEYRRRVATSDRSLGK